MRRFCIDHLHFSRGPTDRDIVRDGSHLIIFLGRGQTLFEIVIVTIRSTVMYLRLLYECELIWKRPL